MASLHRTTSSTVHPAVSARLEARICEATAERPRRRRYAFPFYPRRRSTTNVSPTPSPPPQSAPRSLHTPPSRSSTKTRPLPRPISPKPPSSTTTKRALRLAKIQPRWRTARVFSRILPRILTLLPDPPLYSSHQYHRY